MSSQSERLPKLPGLSATAEQSLTGAILKDRYQVGRLRIQDLVRAPSPNAARDRAVDRLLLFAASLDAEEIELVMDVGGAAVKHVQRAQSQVSTNSSLKRAARRP